MSSEIHWRLGLEIELLAPRGQSRLDLAEAIAHEHGGTVRRFFHPQSEPSLVAGTPVFHNLTLGFEVLNANQQWVASCVDDLTLQDDLVRETPPRAGWYRVISDDERLLRLVQRQADAQSPAEEVLEPIGRLFGTTPELGPGGMVRVEDLTGASIAIAAPLPGERERPCELVTAPLDDRHHEQLERMLSLALSLGFTAPREGATHLHFDATALQSAGAVANLVQLLATHADALKRLIGCNPHCRRLGPWPDELLETVSRPGFRGLSWTEAQAQLQQVNLTKYCDFNLLNCIQGRPEKNTFEVRILPVWLDSHRILRAAALFVAILQRAREGPVDSTGSGSARALLDELALSPQQRSHWRAE